jgi:hypothetical protein
VIAGSESLVWNVQVGSEREQVHRVVQCVVQTEIYRWTGNANGMTKICRELEPMNSKSRLSRR